MSRDPSPARVARARREGLAPLSTPLASWCAAAAAAATLPWCAHRLLALVTAAMHHAALAAAGRDVSPTDALSDALRGGVAAAAAPVLAALVASTAATLAQTRAQRTATPRDAPQGPLDALAAVACAGGVTLAAGRAWASRAHRCGRPDELATSLAAAGVAVLVAAGVAAVISWVARRAAWREALRETPADARREAREEGGSPEVKSRRRARWGR